MKPATGAGRQGPRADCSDFGVACRALLYLSCRSSSQEGALRPWRPWLVFQGGGRLGPTRPAQPAETPGSHLPGDPWSSRGQPSGTAWAQARALSAGAAARARHPLRARAPSRAGLRAGACAVDCSSAARPARGHGLQGSAAHPEQGTRD